MLKASVSKSCGTTAPAWDGPGLAADDGSFAAQDQQNGQEEGGPQTSSTGCGTDGAEGRPNSPKEPADLEAEERELDRARLADLQSDCSHIRELRAFVADFMSKARETLEIGSPLLRGTGTEQSSLPAQQCSSAVTSATETPLLEPGRGEAAAPARKVQAVEKIVASDLSIPGTEAPGTSGLESRAAMMAGFLVQVILDKGA